MSGVWPVRVTQTLLRAPGRPGTGPDTQPYTKMGFSIESESRARFDWNPPARVGILRTRETRAL